MYCPKKLYEKVPYPTPVFRCFLLMFLFLYYSTVLVSCSDGFCIFKRLISFGKLKNIVIESFHYSEIGPMISLTVGRSPYSSSLLPKSSTMRLLRFYIMIVLTELIYLEIEQEKFPATQYSLKKDG